MTEQTQHTSHAALPAWFVWFQDHIGLSLLVLALMGINGIVYASGVVPDVERPDTWGLMGTVLFVLFFAAGAAMPGVALRAGAGIFAGEWYRRLCCLLVSALFFGLEVWTSITERSLNTQTSPADRWLMSVIGQPHLPFSPTVLVISLAISLVVVVWGLVTGVRAVESAEDVAHSEHIKTIKARAAAERRAVQAAGWAGAARAAVQAATQDHSTDIPADDVPALEGTTDVQSAQDRAEDGEPDARPMRSRERGRSAAPAGLMSSPEFRSLLARGGVFITPEKARGIVQTEAQHQQIGTTLYASKRALNARAKRMINEAHPTISLVS